VRAGFGRPVAKGGEGEASQASALSSEGDQRRRSGDFGAARQLYARALALEPDEPQARYGLALLDAQSGDYAPAARRLTELLAQYPGHANGWNALGNVHKLERRWREAAASYERALALEPRLSPALSNLGICLRNQGRLSEGLAYLERALALEPDNADIVFNHALGMIDAGREAEGEERLRRVIALEPDMAEAHFALGCQLLAAGRFSEGWREYEWRTRAEDWERRNAESSLPWWRGEPRAGRTLLVRAEQGLGDQIMFASCLPDLLAQEGGCIVECDRRLEGLFRRSFAQATVCAAAPGAGDPWRTAASQPDLQVNLGSLPGLLARDAGSFPRHAYLRADPVRVSAWRERLARLGGGPKVGVSWRGGTWNTRQLARSLPLAALAPVLKTAPAAFVSLQYGDCAAEIAQLHRDEGAALQHWPEAIADYEETAALLASLDLVISVQTAVVHLAGALGRPVWVMVPAPAEWRYMRSADVMPWYASVRLFRQHAPGDWQPVIERLLADLAGDRWRAR
jgi:tetratricopeptide (TPR) repeat protein